MARVLGQMKKMKLVMEVVLVLIYLKPKQINEIKKALNKGKDQFFHS